MVATSCITIYNGTDWEMVSDDRLAQLDQISCIDPIIDENGFPHLIYHDSTRNALMYAYEAPSGWHFQTVVPTDGVVKYFSLALDGYGEPHISFLGTLLDGTGGLYYAHRQGSDWSIEFFVKIYMGIM